MAYVGDLESSQVERSRSTGWIIVGVIGLMGAVVLGLLAWHVATEPPTDVGSPNETPIPLEVGESVAIGETHLTITGFACTHVAVHEPDQDECTLSLRVRNEPEERLLPPALTGEISVGDDRYPGVDIPDGQPGATSMHFDVPADADPRSIDLSYEGQALVIRVP